MFRACLCTITLAVLLMPGVAFAADGSVLGACASSTETNHWTVDILLSKNAPREALKNVQNYRLIDENSGTLITILEAKPGSRPTEAMPGDVSLAIDPTARLNPERHMILLVRQNIFDATSGAFMSAGVRIPCRDEEKATDPAQDNGSQHLMTVGKGKDDSDIYLSGLANGAKGKKFSYTGDIKLSYPWIFGRARIYTVRPLFTYQASTDPKADPDAMTIGVDESAFYLRHLPSSSPVSRMQVVNSAQVQGTKDLNAYDFIYALRLNLLLKVKQAGDVTLYGLPYVAQSLGASISSPLPSTSGTFLARPEVGADMFLVGDVNRKALKQIVLETNGHRSWILRNEATLDTNSSGATVAILSNTKPKDYVKTSLTFAFGDFWGLTLAHEYGQLPPLYKLVDNKMSVGLTFKAVLKR